jgi:hypothetical protein
MATRIDTWDRLPFSIVREEPPAAVTEGYLATLNSRWAAMRETIVAAALRDSLSKEAAR